MINDRNSKDWLGLMIGNSRLHWAFFSGNTLQQTWDSEHHSTPVVEGKLPQAIFPADLGFLVRENIPLYIASVVPSQARLWQEYSPAKIITLEEIPLKKLYPTLGIDRALAAIGAGITYGFPCLVIDAGTALTFTAVDSDHALMGGAILPGLGLQLQTLARKTAALPDVSLPELLPPRWALNTPEAIKSGVIYTLMAGVKDFIEHWWTQFPSAVVVVTGGDSQSLWTYLQTQTPEIAQAIKVHGELIFWGMRVITNSYVDVDLY
ncbi:pantothenate kinase [Gloeothece verrucosa]|uniref:Type III pantothenate kinase n=1 Tax=Gloeothece verrucosa (strain PCC 7822) TaxID=497965 RepID=E0UEH4_GLOV7|nr:pantothenate kinase [Gloeothece verrucosa]ADN15420.1 putative transcriptional acitvator, Baf family [Gloeothece verrucosa PCC 7822]